MNAPYTHQEMITRAHVAIFGSPHWCWLTQVVLLGRVHIVEATPQMSTAATDGYNVWYTKSFLNLMWQEGGDKAIRMLVLHENLHKALRHAGKVGTWANLNRLNPGKYAHAIDHVVNNLATEEPNFCMTPAKLGGTYDPQYAGMSVGQVFELLPEPPGGWNGNGGFDIHLDGDSVPDDEGNALSADEVSAQVQAAVQQGLYAQRQKNPDAADRNAKLVEPQIDWREVLRNWLSGRTAGHDLADWRRPARRSASLGVFMPKHYAEQTARIAVGVDVSGSISSEQLGQFLSEVAALCESLQPAACDVVYWDGRVEKWEAYTPNNYTTMATSFSPKGGGSTDPGVFLRWVKEQSHEYRGVLLMTDGYVPSFYEGQWPCEILAIINTEQPCPLPHARIT